VRAATARPRAAVESAIRYGLEHGLLEYTSANGVCSFRFADSPSSLSVTEVARQAALHPGQRALPAESA